MVAVVQWRYQPYLLNGQPVEVDTNVEVNFVLTEANSTPAQAPTATTPAGKSPNTAAAVAMTGTPINGNVVPPVTAEEQSSIAAKHPEWAAEAGNRDVLKVKKKSLDVGIAALDNGKYEEASNQLGKSVKLLPEFGDWKGTMRRYALIYLGDSFEKRGDFDKAYDAYILSCAIGVSPPASGVPEAKAAQAAGCLIRSRRLSGVEWAAVEVEQARSSDLGLAGILRHFDRATEAQPLEEEARIHKDAVDAMQSYPTFQTKAQAMAVVYEREGRPDLAQTVREQITRIQETNAQSEDDSADSQSTPSTLQMVLQGLSGMAPAKPSGTEASTTTQSNRCKDVNYLDYGPPCVRCPTVTNGRVMDWDSVKHQCVAAH